MSGANKVGLIGPYPPFRGGIAQFTEQFHRHLEAGTAPEFVTGVSFQRQYPEILFPGKSQQSEEETPTRSVPRHIDSINPRSWRRAADYLIGEQISECVFMHWMPFFAPAYASIARRLKKAGISVTAIVHNARPHERQPFGELLNRLFFSRCDRFIALSETVKRDLIASRVEIPISVQPHPTYDQFGDVKDQIEARKKLGIPPNGNVILFFGLVRHYKGLDILLSAMVGNVHEGTHLLIAGEWYEDRSTCQSIIERHALSGRVTIVDKYIPDSEVADYFSAADALVQPYRSATQSGVVQTAFHFGKPVIVTGVGGLPEMVSHDIDGLIVAPEDSGALSNAIEDLFRPTHLERLSEGAFAARERFTWKAFTESFLNPTGPEQGGNSN